MRQCSSTELTVQSARKLTEEVDLSPSGLWRALTTQTMLSLQLSDGSLVIIMSADYAEEGFAVVRTAAGIANLHTDGDIVTVVIKNRRFNE